MREVKIHARPGGKQPSYVPVSGDVPPAAVRLLRAIFDKTGGRSRGVRDVAELETGLTADEARAGWGDLLARGLIERFSTDYSARLSVEGIDFIESHPIEAAPSQAPGRQVLIVHGHGTGAREMVAGFVEEIAFHAVMLQAAAEGGPTIMEQVESHGDAAVAVVLLTREDLGVAAGGLVEFHPRLNVLMDLGYLIGRLGRTKVYAFAIDCAMDGPADLAGVAIESFDAAAGWKAILVRALGRP